MNFPSVVFAFVSMSGLIAQVPSPSGISAPVPNGSFADGEFGQMPKGWVIPKHVLDAGFHGELVEDATVSGGRSILFSHEPGNGYPGNFTQVIDAKPFQGKRIRLRSRLRLEGSGQSGAAIWLRVDRNNNKTAFFDNMFQRQVTQSTWNDAEIIGDVAADAKFINVGGILFAPSGKMWVAPFLLEVLGDAPVAPIEQAKPLTVIETRNITAFSKALGYVRFFHPSDEANLANWNRLAATGVRAMQGATTTDELLQRLRIFFAPYAPSVQFLKESETVKRAAAPMGSNQLVRWEHTGYWEKDPQSPYHNQRQYIPFNKWKEKGWGDPSVRLRKPLAKGITIALPSMCFADSESRTLPLPGPIRPGKSALPEPTSESGLANVEDRATRLGDVALAWGVIQHFYPYFDVNKADWDAELTKALRSAACDGDGKAFSHTLRRMVASLKDGHGRVVGEVGPGQFIPTMGITMIGEEPVVAFSTGSASEVKPGSLILSVDGEPVSARVARMKEETSAATLGWMNAQVGLNLLAGDRGTAAKLFIKSPSGKEEEFSLPRDSHTKGLKDTRLPAPVSEPRPGLWYVDLDRISEKEFNEALPRLLAAKGVVLDLRGYPKLNPAILGHLSDKPLEWISAAIPIVTLPDRMGWTLKQSDTFTLGPKLPRLQAKVVFLSGGTTLSLAESWMELVEVNKLGVIVGGPTGGTNGAINRISLPGNYQIVWTGVRHTRKDGRVNHGSGIQPTIPAYQTIKGIAEGLDEILEKGLEVASQP